jgi:four helix bundle protein
MGKGFVDLEVWQLSKTLVVDIYALTANFPKEEQYGLTSQIRRAVVSISSNIAEGSARGSEKDFARFILMAIGSAAEVKCQLLLAADLAFVDAQATDEKIEKIHQIAKMLKGLRNSILRKAT